MTGRYPPVDGRHAAQLLAELEQSAATMLPEWRAALDPEDVGHALLAIAAHFAEHVTTRLNRTPERDWVEFLRFLETPRLPTERATVPLVFSVAEGRISPIVVPARTQAAAAADGGEIIFETEETLLLQPVRLTAMFAVDPVLDHIEAPPPGFLEPPRPGGLLPPYSVASFAGTGSRTLQITPALGLARDAVIRIAGHPSVYRIETDQGEGVFRLRDPLDRQPAVPGTPVTKVTVFELFRLRTLQEHAVYLGHDRLFNLQQPAEITLRFTPSSVAARLADLPVSYAFWGTNEDEQAEAPDWVDLAPVYGDGFIRLRKSWRGSVVSRALPRRQLESRWLRIRIAPDAPIRTAATAGTLTERITLEVSSQVPARPNHAEGSQTITRALHNLTPLPLTSRFFPFGAEPLRFDTFAIAAPEALSKRGARVRLQVNLVDASPVTIASPFAAGGVPRAYAISESGALQIVTLRPNDGLVDRWQGLGFPTSTTTPVQPPSSLPGGRLRGDVAPLAVGLPGLPEDVVFAMARDGRTFWATLVGPAPNGFATRTWLELPSLPAERRFASATLLIRFPILLLLALTDGGLYALDFTSGWTLVAPTGGGTPVFGFGADPSLPRPQLTAVQPAGFPAPVTTSRIVVADAAGALWAGNLSPVGSRNWTVAWQPLAPDNSVSLDVRTAAVEDGNGYLVFAAAPPNRELVRFSVGGQGPLFSQSGFFCDGGSSVLCAPRYAELGVTVPLAVAFGTQAGIASVALWTAPSVRPAVVDSPVATRGAAAIVFSTGTAAAPLSLVQSGEGETLSCAPLSPPPVTVDVTLHDWIGVAIGTVADYAAATAVATVNPGDRVVALDRNSLAFEYLDNSGQRWRLYAPGATWLDGQSTVTLFRSVGPFDATPTATPATIELDPSDQNTGVNSLILIDQTVHRVTAITVSQASATLATITPPPPAGSTIPYARLVVTQPASAIADRQRRTLARLATTAPAQEPAALRFPAAVGADPQRQSVTALGAIVSGGIWALLAAAWTTRPAPPGGGALTAELLQARLGPSTPSRFPRNYQNPSLSWEYFNGQSWRTLEQDFADTTSNLEGDGAISFTVPNDLAPSEIAGQEDYWIRVRLVGGDYGRPQYIVTTTPGSPAQTQTITVDTSQLNPPEILSIEATFAPPPPQSQAPDLPEQLVTDNNHTLRLQTEANAVAGAAYELFEGAQAIDPGAAGRRSLYLGFSGPLSPGTLSFFVDAEELEPSVDLEAQVLVGGAWQTAGLRDETAGLQRRGLLQVSLAERPTQTALFGSALSWLRLRPRADARDWQPALRSVLVNAVRAEHAESISRELLGSSDGSPNQGFFLSRTPVLLGRSNGDPDEASGEGPELRIRETLGLAEQRDLDVARYPADPDMPGDWVRWRRVESLVDQDGSARVFLLDPFSGEVRFGDGRSGRVPPAGRDNIRVIAYRAGGEARGNVPAFAIENLKTAIESVDQVVNPIAAAGGVDAPTREEEIARAPARFQHRDQAMTPRDLEALALTFSPDVVRARCLPPGRPGAPVILAVAMRNGGTRCPGLALERRDALRAYLRRRDGGVFDAVALEVRGPDYLRLRVAVQLRLVDRTAAARIEQGARQRIFQLFDPLAGGPDGRGWPFGRLPRRSDVLRVLSGLEGIDQVIDVTIAAVDDRTLPDRPGAISLICVKESDDVRIVVSGAGGDPWR